MLVGQCQGEEAAEVDRSGAMVQLVVVFGDAAVTEAPVAADEPGDGAFDHGPVLPVDGLELRAFRVAPGSAL